MIVCNVGYSKLLYILYFVKYVYVIKVYVKDGFFIDVVER